MEVAEFIDRWKRSGGAELANSQSFLKELCDLLGVPHPEPKISDEEQNSSLNTALQRPLRLEDDADEDTQESPKGKSKISSKKSKTKATGGNKPADNPAVKLDWPKSLPDKIRAVRSELESLRLPIAPEYMAKRFTRAPKNDVAEILETLVAVGKARQNKDGRYAA